MHVYVLKTKSVNFGIWIAGCLHTVGVIGPLFGYSLGSLCASLYVDIGLVNPGEFGQLEVANTVELSIRCTYD